MKQCGSRWGIGEILLHLTSHSHAFWLSDPVLHFCYYDGCSGVSHGRRTFCLIFTLIRIRHFLSPHFPRFTALCLLQFALSLKRQILTPWAHGHETTRRNIRMWLLCPWALCFSLRQELGKCRSVTSCLSSHNVLAYIKLGKDGKLIMHRFRRLILGFFRASGFCFMTADLR